MKILLGKKKFKYSTILAVVLKVAALCEHLCSVQLSVGAQV